ncbi:NUDIX domain-containing protein [Candidatus Woesebacteria bacterium]|nr:NUDIX domain-containing protein [Candidatus Woesebacteria bacterium]
MNEPTLHQLTKNVKLLQKAVLWHGDTFLILKRSAESKTRPDQWDLPGGNSEWPAVELENQRDLHKDDVVREIFEETGIELSRTDIKKCSHISTFFEAKTQIFAIIVGWEVKLPATFKPDSILLSAEHSDFAWITTAQFDSYDFGFAGEKDGFIREIVGL